MCYLAASRSTDESTHAGAVIVRPDNSVVSTGYNGPVRGMSIEDVPKTRPEKYFYMEHAERNAVYNAAKNQGGLAGCSLYVNFLPCADCARAIVQAGIVRVIVHKQGQEAFQEASGNTGGEWDESHKATLKIFSSIYEREETVIKTMTNIITYPAVQRETSILHWWSGKLSTPVTGFFRGQEFTL